MANTLPRIVFWLAGGALVWTHAGYPLAAAAVARLRPRPVRKEPIDPEVTVIVAAHDEEAVIAARLENLLALDYPGDKLDIVVASDASSDATDEIVTRIAGSEPRVRLIQAPRGGKVAAQNLAVRETGGEIVAFSDANSTWAPDALEQLVANFADTETAYVCGRLSLLDADGTNREGAYWRYEVWLRAQESALGSVTGGNGSIYALRRSDYVEVDPRFGHDLAFPYLMVQRGRRATFEPEAVAFEKPARDLEDEYRRKERMFEHCWLMLFEGEMFRNVDPVYLGQLVSHRLLRYGSGLLHLALFTTSIVLARERGLYRFALTKQLGFLALAAAGRARLPIPGAALAYYYVLVTSATATALVRYLRFGVPAIWEKAEGTR